MLHCMLRFYPSTVNTAAAGLVVSTQRHPHAFIARRTLSKIERPSIDDVDRISRGQGAKRRGVGSRNVPHRLNSEERVQFDLAKKKGFLSIKGTAYRRERRGSPLANIFRQWCDARGTATCLVSQQLGDNDQATVLLDLSTLRDPARMASAATALRTIAAAQGAAWLADPAAHVPFTCITDVPSPDVAHIATAVAAEGVDGAQQGTGMAAEDGGTTVEDGGAVAEDGGAVAEDGDQGEAEEAPNSVSQMSQLDDAWATLAIWQLPPVVVAFSCGRAASKSLVQTLAKAVAQMS